MATAAIAFSEIGKARPDLIEKIGALMLKHPDPSSYWVAAGEARGHAFARRTPERTLLESYRNNQG